MSRTKTKVSLSVCLLLCILFSVGFTADAPSVVRAATFDGKDLDTAVEDAILHTGEVNNAEAIPDTVEIKGVEISFNDNFIEAEPIPDTPVDMYDEVRTMSATTKPYSEECSENPLGKWQIGDYMLLPKLSSYVMFGTDYHFYNLPGTPHYRMQEAAWTDEIGCRRYKDYYMVGLGSYYTVCIGDCFEITLENGTVFNIILGDGKADCDTDGSNRYTPCNWFGENCANILEFIIDKEAMDPDCYHYGGIHYYDKFRSNIVSMRYLGRDNSMDWDTYY